MPNNNNNKLFLLLGGAAVIVIIIIIIFATSQKSTTESTSTQSGQSVALGKDGSIALQTEATKKEPVKPNANATFEIGNGTVTPKSFMIEFPADATLTLVSIDNKAHEIVFVDPEIGLSKVNVAAGESKKVIFKPTKIGQYSFTGDNGETGELIVSNMPTKPNTIAVVDKAQEENRIPGANLYVAEGSLIPNKFTVVAELPVSLAITSKDGQAHSISFSDKTVTAEVISVGANETKSIVFNAPKAGEYEFKCTLPGHEKESGIMIVK